MTNEEAIKKIKKIIEESTIFQDELEAFDMAIKALENERPKGEWIKNNYRMVKRYKPDKSELVFDCTCSICRYTTGKQALKFSICPVCGTEMEVKNDN